ncbi:hypothetical protein [Microbacterium maritypicum]|uniref:hypothetical protein n=1 Tax=Microbacterium maritypicum TaxID=33918 RepID=UPI003CE6CFF1
MKRSACWYLIFFVIVVATGAALILLVPAAIAPDTTSQIWIPSLLGAVFAASAFAAWKVRPRWKKAPPTRP